MRKKSMLVLRECDLVLLLAKVGTSEISVTPTEIIEESRCPIGVQCIQAGTVRVKLAILLKNTSTTEVIKLGTPLQVGAHIVTLTDVTPLKKAGEVITPAEYRFTFEIK